MLMKEYRVNVEVSRTAWLKLMAEARRRCREEGRKSKKYPIWRIVDERLQTLPEPEEELEEELEEVIR